MSFEKGKSGNPRGRRKGSSNKDTKALRERLGLLLDSSFDQLKDDLKSLTAKERIEAYSKLLEYCLPKLGKTEIDQKQTSMPEVRLYIPHNARTEISEEGLSAPPDRLEVE